MNQIDVATIYILRQGCSLQHIAPGSGIVGRPDRNGLTLLYYEGNLLDTPTLHTYESRIACSARRLFENIPTTALVYVGPQSVEESLLAVGEVEWNLETETCSISLDPSKSDLMNNYLQQSLSKES